MASGTTSSHREIQSLSFMHLSSCIPLASPEIQYWKLLVSPRGGIVYSM